MGRRWRILLVALAGATILSRIALAQEQIRGNVYANPALGLEITKPSTWHFLLGPQLHREVGEGEPAATGADGLPPGAAMAQIPGRSRVVLAIADTRPARDSRALVLIALEAPPGDLGAASLSSLAASFFEELRGRLEDLQVISPPTPTVLGDLQAVRWEVAYGAAQRLRHIAYYVLRGEQVVAIEALAREDVFDKARPRLNAILQSVAFSDSP